MSERERLPLKPVAEGEDDDWSFLGAFMKNFVIVNGLIFIGAVCTPNFRAARGSTASSHVDPRTRQPVLMEMQGCRVVNSDAESGLPPPPPLERTKDGRGR